LFHFAIFNRNFFLSLEMSELDHASASDSKHPPSNAYKALLTQIESLCIDPRPHASLDLSLSELNSNDRRRLYERIDVYCVGKLSRTRQDVFDGKTNVVHLHVTRVPITDNTTPTPTTTQNNLSKPIKVGDKLARARKRYSFLPFHPARHVLGCL
jgi:hypothetical protein